MKSGLLSRLWARRSLISTQMYVGIGSVLALTIAASFVGWFSFNTVDQAQSKVSEESLPEMEAAFRIADHSRTMAAAAPRLIAAEPDEVDTFGEEIALAQVGFEEQILTLRDSGGLGSADYVADVQDLFFQLSFNVDRIRGQLGQQHFYAFRTQEFRVEIGSLRTQIESLLIPALDDQLFFQLTGYRTLREPPADRSVYLSEQEFNRYRHLATLKSETTLATQLLSSAETATESAFIEPLQESFESASGRILISLDAIREADIYDEVRPLFDRLLELGTSEGDGFDLLASHLRLQEQQDRLLQQTSALSDQLIDTVDELVAAAREAADEANRASNEAISTGRTLLVVISVLGVLAAFVISYGFVWRVVLRRIRTLSERMREMSAGRLEAKIDIKGDDEIAEMAGALEVFRRHALELQRLNLIEEMAEELVEKNQQLEEVLSELSLAQDQIVAQEKLAALGEVTAGVAHEIRNPLNFVKNFSEASEELIEELQEILEEDSPDFEEIDDITQDLTDNLERIRKHSARANRIVEDMLMIGRGGGEWQIVDLNTNFDEHALLAFHSARAIDPEFQLHLERDFDPEVGGIEAIPQDLGRVFLNMVSNSCHATDAKRQSLAERGGENYLPTVLLATKRVGDRVRVTIRDNGEGVPPELIDQIFNPFFTTKPANKGTGLGLALSSDIIRTHGGRVEVDSELGEYTSMTVELPLRQASAPDSRASDTEDETEPEGGNTP